MSATLFALSQVRVQRGASQVLRELSLRIQAGERVALVGANGSGKSSLLRVLHGLLPVQAGQFVVAPGMRQSMVFQHPYALRTSVLNNVRLGLWLGRRAGWREAEPLARAALARVGLQALAERPARVLSGGQLQRLALARAWALQPEVWLLDEPTASLDPHAKREVEALIQTFADTPGLTLIMASHNLGQVKRLAQRVIYLEGGRILADLPVQTFFDRAALPLLSPQADLFVRGELN